MPALLSCVLFCTSYEREDSRESSFHPTEYAVGKPRIRILKEWPMQTSPRVTANTKVSIVVPAWNEEERLPSCIARLLEFTGNQTNYAWEIIICADGSTDRTLSIANEYASKNPRVKVSYWPERLGKGGGLLHGLNSASGDVVVVTDVDLSAPPDQIPRLVSPIASGLADLTLGSRNLRESIILVRAPAHRIVLGRGFNLLVRLVFHLNFRDTQCGLKAIAADLFRDLSTNLSAKDYAFDVDLLVNAVRKGHRVLEIPVVWRYRKGSKISSLRQIAAMGRSLLVIWLQNRRATVQTKSVHCDRLVVDKQWK